MNYNKKIGNDIIRGFTERHNKKDQEKIIKDYIQADLRLIKIQNALILVATILLSLIVVLFAMRAMYSIKEASAKTTVSVSASVKSNPCNRCLLTYNYKKNLLQKIYCVRICRAYINNLK